MLKRVPSERLPLQNVPFSDPQFRSRRNWGSKNATGGLSTEPIIVLGCAVAAMHEPADWEAMKHAVHCEHPPCVGYRRGTCELFPVLLQLVYSWCSLYWIRIVSRFAVFAVLLSCCCAAMLRCCCCVTALLLCYDRVVVVLLCCCCAVVLLLFRCYTAGLPWRCCVVVLQLCCYAPVCVTALLSLRYC